MPLRILISTLLALVLSAAAAPAGTPPGPGPKDRCAVCGMFVAPYPDWIAAIQFKDGTNAYFDGPKDMFIYFFDIDKYRPNFKDDDILDIHVTEYYSTGLMRAEEVFFVTGSDVLGPMGNELVPVHGREQAKTFLRDHGGKKIMQFNGKNLVEFSDTP
jgi:nitrous oxide reductase accessory protein NosL